MKNFLMLAAVLLTTITGFGQSAQRINTALQVGGKEYATVVPLANVYVCAYNAQSQCVTQVPIYADVARSQRITQPLRANSAGVYQYYIATGVQVIEKVCTLYNQCTYNAVMSGPTTTNAGTGTVTTTGSVTPGSLVAFSGSTSVTNATVSQLNAMVQNLAGCNTANNVYTPQSSNCVPIASFGVASFTGDGNFATNTTSTGAVTLALHTAPAHTFWGNNTGSTAAPGYETIGLTDLPSIPITKLGTIAANSVLGNAINSFGAITALAMPSCSAANDALNWTSGVGFGCNTNVGSINGTPGNYVFTFASGAGSCTGTTCSFTGTSSGTVSAFSVGSWPSFLTPSVTNPTSTPSLAVALASQAQFAVFAGPQGGAGTPTFQTTLAGLTVDGVSPSTMAFVDPTSSVQTQLNGKASSTAGTTVNGVLCTLGSTCTVSSSGVSSINASTGAFTFSFSAGAGSCSGTTCTFTGSGSGGGSVTNVIVGDFSPLFTSSVATSTTTPTVSFAAATTAQFAVYAGPQGGSGAASFQTTLGGITIDGVTPTTMGFVDPTSSIQTQLNSKASSTATLTLGSTTLTLGGTTTAVTGLTIDTVSPATMAFVDPTSSIQTQLNGKQATLGYVPAHAGSNSDITSLSGLTTPLSAAQGGTGAISLGTTLGVSGGVLNCTTATASVLGCVKPDGTTITISAGVLTAVGGGGGGITQLTGDGAAGPGSGSQVLTLKTVNASPGTCGDSTHVCQVTVNAKGLTTTQTAVAISTGGTGTITGVTAGKWLTGGGVSGTVTLNATTQRGVDAVVDLGMDNTGATSNSTKLTNYFASLSSTGVSELHMPCGTYYFATTVNSGNASGIKIIGDGQNFNFGTGCVTITSDQALSSIWWFDTTTSGSNLYSVWLEHLNFQDTSTSHNKVKSAIRITNQANMHLEDVGGFQLEQTIYSTGTASVTQGSTAVTGSGTTWNASTMMPGFVWVNGYPYEIQSINSATSITLFTAYQGSTNGSAGYDLASGGIFAWFDPGLGFTQYGTVINLKSHTVSVPIYMQSGNTGAEGTSRIKFLSGYVNCAGSALPDSIGAYFGNFSDTHTWHVAENSCAIGVVIASGHQHDIQGSDYENAGSTIPLVPTCGANPNISCSKGVLIMSDNSSNTYGNRVVDNYMRQVGNAIELYGQSSNPPTQSKIAFNTFRSNTNDCVFNSATQTTGECDGTMYTSGTGSQIQTNVNTPTDLAGFVTLSGGTGTYSFTGGYSVAPVCTASDNTNVANNVKPVATASTLTLTGTGSDVISFICIGRT